MKKVIHHITQNPKFLAGVFIAIVLIGAYFVRFSHKEVVKPDPSITALSIATFADKIFTKRDNGVYIKIHYPEYSEVMPFLAIANASIRTNLKKEVDDFLQNENDVIDNQSDVSKLTGEYTINAPIKGVVTIIYKLKSESKSGSNPYEYSSIINLNDTDGHQIRTADFFNQKTVYWKDLSDISKKKLKDVLGEDYDEDMVNDGASNDIKNFENVRLSENGLIVTFSPYQVAPYTTGEIEVTIPFSDLKNDLLPRYIGK